MTVELVIKSEGAGVCVVGDVIIKAKCTSGESGRRLRR